MARGSDSRAPNDRRPDPCDLRIALEFPGKAWRGWVSRVYGGHLPYRWDVQPTLTGEVISGWTATAAEGVQAIMMRLNQE